MFKLYTEDVNRERVIELAQDFLSGFTVTYGEGFWEGKREKTLIIETTVPVANVQELARAICVENDQESVLVERFDSGYSEFITRPHPEKVMKQAAKKNAIVREVPA